MRVDDPARTIGRLSRTEPDLRLGADVACAAVWSHGPLDVTVEGLATHVVALHLGGSPLVERWLDGRVRGGSRIGSVSLIPAHERSRWVMGGLSRVGHVYLDATALERAGLEQGRRGRRIEPFFAAHDPVLAARVGALVAGGAAIEPLRRDELLAGIQGHLLARYLDTAGGPTAPPVAALAPAALRRVLVHIDDHLDQPLRLATLAALVHQSPDHFLRSFRRAVGQTPHRYLLEARVLRARRLLGGTRLSIGEVAMATGFRSASHFTQAFRDAVGMPPGRWRSTRR